MRRAYILCLIGLVIAGILAFAASQLRYERSRLLDEFARSQQLLVQDIAGDLEKELQKVDEDSSLVANLVLRTTTETPLSEAAADALVLSGFRSLATVVRHYRMVGLFMTKGQPLYAGDPREEPALVRELLDWGATAAGRARRSGQAILDGVRESASGRQFYLFANPMPGEDVLVLASEVPLFLQMVLRPRPARVRYFVLDPARAMWVGCGEAASCRALGFSQWSAVAGLRGFVSHLDEPDGVDWGADAMAASLGLPERSAVVAWQTVTGPGGMPWTMGLVTSAQVLEIRERSLYKRLLIVSTALLLSLGMLGTVLFRHMRRSAVLQERLRTAQEIAHLRERSEKIVDNVPVGLLGVDRGGNVALVNRFLQERVGQVTLGAPLAQAFSGEAEGVGALLGKAFDQAVSGRRPQRLLGSPVSLPGPRPGYFEARVIPLQQASADLSALVLLEDFSEIKRLEHQLVRAEKLLTTGVLTAGLAHEIGTPLTIIRARAESLLERVKETGIRRDLESVIAQIDHIAATIRRVLDFSRAQPVEVRPTEVRAALTAVVSMLAWKFQQKDLSVRVETTPEDPTLPPVSADPDQLQQVLVNLLLNAADACNKRGSIVVTLASQGHPEPTVKIEIRDDGCGIPAEHINAVFDPFFTTKKRGEGTGLGLSVVSSIVRNHGGEVALSSQVRGGTTVVVHWPAALKGAVVTHA